MIQNKTIGLMIVTSFFSLYLQAGSACDKNMASDFDHIVSIVKGSDGDNRSTESYGFSTDNCVKAEALNMSSSEAIALPKDETSLGLYSQFRQQGESETSSIKHVQQFVASYEN